MSNPRKPGHLKVIAGTDQPCRRETIEIDYPPLEQCPDPPDWLPNSHALKEWNRLGRILTANKLLNDANLAAFGQLCALHGKLTQLWAAGETPTGHLLAQYRNLINDFGLTPVARGRVKAAPEGKGANKFAALKDTAKPTG
jgi:hypothetical protein